MTKEIYQACMTKNLRGMPKNISKEERKLSFCQFSKLCSGKAKDMNEALKICSLPKPPKATKVKRVKKGQSCEKEVLKLSSCIADVIDMDQASNINSVEMAIANALAECYCGSKD